MWEPHLAKACRFIDANLNRLFRDPRTLSSAERNSYEYQRAQFLKPYLNQADALLDLHSTSIPNSKAFAICEANAKRLIRFLPVDLVVSGFDQVEPGGTDYYMNRRKKIGICLECGYTKVAQSVKIAKKSILAFLKARDHVKNDLVPQKQSYIRLFQKYFAQTDQFILSRPFKNFELLKKNQLIGLDGSKNVTAPKQSIILFAHNGTRVHDEVFLLGEKRRSLT